MSKAKIVEAGVEDVADILGNQGAVDFYRSLGAEPMSDWTVYRLSGDALQRLATAD